MTRSEDTASQGHLQHVPLNRSLRIGVDVRGLEVESSLRRGIGRYVCNLIRALAALATNHQITLYGQKMPWEVSHLAPLLERRNVRYGIFHRNFADDLDVLLLTDPAPLLIGRELVPFDVSGLPYATIFYDLIPLAFEQQYLRPNVTMEREYHARLQELKASASLFLTISRFVAEDLQARLDVPANHVVPIMGGLDHAFAEPPSKAEVSSTLQRFNITKPYFFYTGGADHRKNLASLLSAFQQVRANSKTSVRLILAGEFTEDWRRQVAQSPALNRLIDGVITVGYVSDEDLKCLYAGSLAFVFPSLYEGFGLPALEAMASGCPVIASNGSSLKEIVADAGLLVNPESPSDIAAAMLVVQTSPALADNLRARGLKRAALYTWSDVAAQTLSALESIARPGKRIVAPSRHLRVLIQNRANAFESPGGDTVVMEELYRGLRNFDVDVDVACGSPDLSNVDLVHLVNLTVSDVAREVAENCARQHVPYTVTTLLEDWPHYLDRSFEAIRLFKDYLSSNYDERLFQAGLKRLRSMPDGPRVGNDEVVGQAALLFACGESETQRLLAVYPSAAEKTRIAKFGIRSGGNASPDSRERVLRSVGFDRFVLCCGRLESRKNQLMLLKALEDSDLPIIFASGGFSYQPLYVDLVSQYHRKGEVKVLGRISNTMLRDLMSAATVHVLPSWYELPGLVTLEAAVAGTAIVASDWGAIQDYLPGGLVHLCQPDDPDSIRSAIESALRSGPNPRAREVAASHTWEAFGEATYNAYEQLLTKRQSKTDQSKYVPVESTMNSPHRKSWRYDASIIIPVYNRAQLTQECLEALVADQPRANYEMIIVDNHSTDETPRFLEKLEGDVTILRQPENRGFAAACNLGARMASGEFLVFLNNDTLPQPGWLDNLVDCARANSNAGAVGAKLLYPDGTVQHAGVAVNVNGIPYHVFQNFAGDHAAANEQRDMQAVTAACMLVPSVVFTAIGGFEEAYRNGFEDIDLCMRLRAEQYRVIYCPLSTVIHHEEASEGRKAYDRENLERFLGLWKDKLIVDDTELLSRHGYTMEWGTGRGTYKPLAATTTPEVQAAVSIDDAQKLYSEGKLEEAAAALQSLVENRMVLGKEDTFETWQTLGNCLARLNRVDEAEKAYCEAIKLDEASERPYLGLGALAMLQENWQAAMYGFMTALAKNPGTIRGEFGVALSMAVRNMHCDALEHFRRVLEREPHNAEALFYFYRSAVESGRPQIAIEPLQNYLNSYPNDTNFLFSLCGAYWKSGELARATEICQQILELDPDHIAARDVMEHLKGTVLEHA